MRGATQEGVEGVEGVEAEEGHAALSTMDQDVLDSLDSHLFKTSSQRTHLWWSVQPGQSSLRKGEAGRPAALTRLTAGLSAQP